MKATESQIKNWKKEHGEIFEIEVLMDEENSEDIAHVYVTKPKLDVLTMAEELTGNGENLRALESMYNACVIKADERISQSDEARLSVMTQTANLFKVKASTIKKL